MHLGKTVLSILMIIAIILPAPVMAGGKDPVLYGNDKQFNDYINSLPESKSWEDNYEICFYADTEGSGHGFIKIQPPGGELKGYGFYPLGGNPFWTDGVIQDDTNHVWNHKVCFRINKYKYVEVLKTIREWRNKDYTLLARNCVAFVNEVADAIGINSLAQLSHGGAIPQPDVLDYDIKHMYGSVENENGDKSKEIIRDPAGNWIREPRKKDDSLQTNQTTNHETTLCSPDDLKETINQQVEVIPAEINPLIENKQILLTIEYDQVQQQVTGRPSDTLGIVFQGTQVSKIGETIDNPDIRVYAKESALGEIFTTKDPIVTYRMALARGDVRIVHSNLIQNILISGAGLLNKVSALINPSQYLIKTGERKDVLIGGKPYILLHPGKIILLQDEAQPYATVINSDGVPQGYITPGAAHIITISAEGHSPNSGVYMNPIPTIQKSALNGFSIPADYRGLMTKQASQATQYTMRGGASNAGLILGGVGFAYGYGR